MSAPTGEAAALPVTGSGPFTFVLGLIGLGAIAVGALMRSVSRSRGAAVPRHEVPHAPERPDVGSDLPNSIAPRAR